MGETGAQARPPAGSRQGELADLLQELEVTGAGSPGDYNALAMMLADAALSADEGTLAAGQKGLQRLYARQLRAADASPELIEERGRVLGLIDVLQWLLRRVIPVTSLKTLEPGSYAHRFLTAIAARPGLTNRELADHLETDMTEVSRVGRRLIEAGVARKRRLGRTKSWEITPRGADVLQLRDTAIPTVRFQDQSVLRRFAQQVIEVANLSEQLNSNPRLMPFPGRVLATLLASGRALSCGELVDKTSFSPRVVNAAVAFLSDAGYVTRAANGKRSHFRRHDVATPLTVNVDDYCALGVKILPTRLVGVVTDLRARVLRVVHKPLPDRDPNAVIDAVVHLVAELRDPTKEGLPRYTLGLGIETGGHVDCRSGTVIVSPNLGWREPVHLAGSLRARTDLITVVDNDVNALAIHEQLVGSAIDEEWFAAILVDEGIGGGFILDGQLLRGHSGLAGEIGHIVVDPDGRRCEWCGNRGCVESVASARAIRNAIGEATGVLPDSIEEATNLAAGGNVAAIQAFRDAGAALGRAISILQNLVNPRRILVCVPKPLEPRARGKAAGVFNQSLTESVTAHAFSTAASDCVLDIRHLQAGDVYGAQGAASIVLRRFVHAPLAWRPTPTVIGGEIAPEEADLLVNASDADDGEQVDTAITIDASAENDPLGQFSEKLATLIT